MDGRSKPRTQAQLDSLTKARSIQAKMPRTAAQKRALAKGRARAHELGTVEHATEAAAQSRNNTFDELASSEQVRKENLEQVRQAILENNEQELAELVKEQMKDEKTLQWGNSKTVSLDAKVSNDGTVLYDWLELHRYQESRDQRLEDLLGY